jgi:hypothetical protein
LDSEIFSFIQKIIESSIIIGGLVLVFKSKLTNIVADKLIELLQVYSKIEVLRRDLSTCWEKYDEVVMRIRILEEKYESQSDARTSPDLHGGHSDTSSGNIGDDDISRRETEKR